MSSIKYTIAVYHSLI